MRNTHTSKACISLSFTGFDQNKTEIKHDMKTKAVIYLGNDHFSYITYNIIIIIIIIITRKLSGKGIGEDKTKVSLLYISRTS